MDGVIYCAKYMSAIKHLIRSGGDGSVSVCGVKFPSEITFLISECDCAECLRLHRLETNRHLAIVPFLILLSLVSLACGSALAPVAPQPVDKPQAGSVYVAPVKTSVETRDAVVVHTQFLNVRSCAGVQCPIIGKLDEGGAVKLTGDCETPQDAVWRWCEISEPKGWINTRWIEVK